MAGCESISYVAGGDVGVLLVHGFTGNPSSVRGVAEAMIATGFDVEVPRLPGHGTTVDDMLTTSWVDWMGEVSEARTRLARRVDRVVLAGQSMGGSLVLASALTDPDAVGVICINPLTRTRSDDEMEMLADFLDDGVVIVPGEGSDIADPDSFDIAYDGTPVAPLVSFLADGVAPITERFAELTLPLRLFTSRQDHVVEPADSEYLAGHHGGAVEHTWLDRSYHVATRDFDKDLVIDESIAFVERVGAS